MILKGRCADSDRAITASALFYFLLKNPRCYAELQKEVDNVSLQGDGDANYPTFPLATAQGMHYLNACINESMRLHSVTRLPHDRVVPPGGLEVAGHRVPAGTDVGVHSTVLHRRPEVFGDDVDRYRPERWLSEEKSARRMKNAMFTFSSGKYNCLGKDIARMEILKLVPSVMKTCEVRVLGKHFGKSVATMTAYPAY